MGRSITVRLFASTVTVVVLLGLTWLGARLGAGALRVSYVHTVNTVDALSSGVLRGAKLRDDEETGLRGYLLTGQADFLQPYRAARQQEPALYRSMDALAAGDPRIRPLLLDRRRAGDAWDRWAKQVLHQTAVAPRGSAALVAQQRTGKALFDRYRAATAAVTRVLDQERQADLRASERLLATMGWLFNALFAGAIGLGLLLGWSTTRAVTSPLTALRRAARLIGQGDLTHPVTIAGAPEFLALADSMEWMRARLHAREVELVAAQEALRATVERLSAISTTQHDVAAAGLDTGAVMGLIVERARRMTRAGGAVIEVAEGDELVYRAVSGTMEGYLGTRLKAASTLSGLCVRTGDSLRCDDTATDPRTDPVLCRRLGIGSMIVAPFSHDGVPIGVLKVLAAATHAFDEQDAQTLQLIAGLLAAALGQALAFGAKDEALAALARSKRELERSNDDLQQFAYVASHDLQEPLRTITSYLQLLQRRYADALDTRAGEYIAYAVDGAKRMQGLIQAVLAYSRVDTHGGVFAPTDCNALVQDALTNLGARITESAARVSYDELPVVLGDEAQLGQLFQNLIGNALKFCRDADPRVTITAERAGAEWVIAVRDNGIGIDPAHAERIFAMFQRLHTREEYEGTGIGLSVCKKIVERHGGRIWAESQPGQGATFRFTLPAIVTDEKRAA